jgi:hypothetical protein
LTETPVTVDSLVPLARGCNQLTHLALRRCANVDDAALARFFAALPAESRRKRLRTLDVSYCPLLTPATLDLLASNRKISFLFHYYFLGIYDWVLIFCRQLRNCRM